jgi:hypothetical protein
MKTIVTRLNISVMRNLIIILALVFSASIIAPVMAQSTEREAEKELNKKSMKKARKEAKKYRKAGFYVAPGALPMDIQLEYAWKKQMMMDDEGFPMYITATGNSVAESQTAAKIQATETAKLELAGTITTNVAALIENNIANQQLNTKDAASVTKTVAASKNIIAQELGRVLPLFEVYKKIGKENVEADIRLAYHSELAYEVAKKVIRKSLEEQTDIMQEKLDKLMDF